MEKGYIKADKEGNQRIWSGNAFYIYEDIILEELENQMPKIISENIGDLLKMFYTFRKNI